MTEKNKKLDGIYSPDDKGCIKPNTYWNESDGNYVCYSGGSKITLDGEFSLDELFFFTQLMEKSGGKHE